ncbi:hypothetical protein F0562_008673 [Nyssa sinensis]|uniref:Uncharacterized protein n=1 Tax=Nyssa sinensis TaxID=561372 RepID=A0A5J5AAP2_9ASTE|nr:hypothetical protein F0562_008673 [Nyssa sinensis]
MLIHNTREACFIFHCLVQIGSKLNLQLIFFWFAGLSGNSKPFPLVSYRLDSCFLGRRLSVYRALFRIEELCLENDAARKQQL